MLRALERVLEEEAPQAGERWLVAFSGGPDSTALAAALGELASGRGLDVVLVHVDHRMDAGSGARALAAARLAARLGLAIRVETIDVPAERQRRESPESAARRLRYAALERIRAELGATRILTAHQRDDQVETVLLRLRRGAPVEQLGGIPERRGPILRPFLAVTRAEVGELLAERGLEPVRDPTNDELGPERNRVRALVLPALRAAEAGLDDALLTLGERSARLRARLADRFGCALEQAGGREIDLLLDLPPDLRPAALRWTLRDRLGIEPLPSTTALALFLSALERNRMPGPLSLSRPGSAPRALRALGRRLVVGPVGAPEIRTPPFSYTFRIPGEVELPELGLTLRVRRSPVETWMLLGDPRRAGFSAEGEWATVRNRRPGDRLRPLGSPGKRKLKEILVDRRLPAAARDRLPLVEIGGRIAWVPGITVDEACRLAGDEPECWCAELVATGEARQRAGRKDSN